MPGIVERTKVTVERTTTDIEVKANILEGQILKIPSEMEVAPRYQLLTLLILLTLLTWFALCTLFIPLRLFYTAQT